MNVNFSKGSSNPGETPSIKALKDYIAQHSGNVFPSGDIEMPSLETLKKYIACHSGAFQPKTRSRLI